MPQRQGGATNAGGAPAWGSMMPAARLAVRSVRRSSMGSARWDSETSSQLELCPTSARSGCSPYVFAEPPLDGGEHSRDGQARDVSRAGRVDASRRAVRVPPSVHRSTTARARRRHAPTRRPHLAGEESSPIVQDAYWNCCWNSSIVNLNTPSWAPSPPGSYMAKGSRRVMWVVPPSSLTSRMV